MRDYGHDETERLISEMEKKVADVYRQSEKELSDKLDDYLKKFETKDAIWQKNVADGKRTLEEYKQWQKGQMLAGYRWQAMRDQVAEDMHNSNAVARSIVMGYRPEAYAINHNFATYQVEKEARVNTGYTLYSRETVERILRDQPELLPAPGASMQKKLHDYKMKTGKDIAWQKGQIQSVMTQAVIQGESIPNISKRIAETLGEMNHKATIRYARTAITGAQNAGRIDAYRRAAEMGIGVKRQWVATIDFRTRHEHRMLDGEVAEVDEPFKTVDGDEIMFPGDPAAEPYLIWNCRCTTIPVVDGLSNDFSGRSDDAIQGMSYDDWKESRYEESHSITKQEEIAELMKRRYINELYGGYGGQSGGGQQPQPPVQPLDSKKLEKTLGSDYDEYKGLVEKSDTAGLYSKYADSCTYVKERSGGFYRHGDDSVHYTYSNREGQNKYSTLAHECGHMFDAHMGKVGSLSYAEVEAVNSVNPMWDIIKPLPSNSDEFLAAVRKDASALKPRLQDLRQEMLATQTLRNSSAGVQDMLDGFYQTQSKGVLPWGHGERYYNRKYNMRFKDYGLEKDLKKIYLDMGFDASNQTKVKMISRVYETASEAWANVASAVTCGGAELEAIEKYMPETLAAFKKIIGEVK